MSKREQLSPTIGPLSPAHQPDEGYSEDPLNTNITSISDQLSSALSALRSPVDLTQWIAANSSLLPISVKTKLTMALLDQLPTSAIVEIVERLNPRLYIDFIRHLPAEICLKILGYLDPISLVSVLRTCRAWCDLALDRKLWESLYYLEGWKAIPSEIDACESKVNAGISTSIGNLYRHSSSLDGRFARSRGYSADQDLEMTDPDRLPSIYDGNVKNGGSIFGSSASPFSPTRQSLPSIGEMDLAGFSSAKGKGVDRGSVGPEGTGSRATKRKMPGGSPEALLPPPTQTHGVHAAGEQADDISSMLKSTLWAWDVNSSRYRVNWKHLYNMRQRLESNWELGKFTTFVLPHPDHPEEGHQECIYTLQFDANYLVSGSRDRTMRVWDMHTRRLVRPPLQGHGGSVLCLQFDADPSEDILVSGSSDSNVFIWKFSTGELVQKITRAHRESVLNVRFDKRILVTSSKDKTIKIFNRRSVPACRLPYHPDQGGIDPVGTPVKAYGYEPDIGEELPLLPPYSMIGMLEGHGAAVNAIQVRGRTIVSVSGDRQIKLWNWPEQICVQTIPAHEKGIACVEFDERRIVSGSSDYEVCIFDALTGLKVASLRGHASLVRTVQAGFADLPYSKAEDETEAKRVDAEYFRAVETGEIDLEGDRRFRRGRRTNAGSSRPADLQAYGAKVPPGGGGGRKYGRIVSGSYDQSIIIWRRDKEGVWKAAHHLRQEAAAEAAYRQAATANAQQSENGGTSASGGGSSTTQPGGGSAPQRDGQDGSEQYRTVIDQVVPLGATALRQALSHQPSILTQHDYLQAMIEQEMSPIVRMQMRQVVTDALVTIQNTQSARQRMRQASSAFGHAAGSSSASAHRTSSGPANGVGGSGDTFDSQAAAAAAAAAAAQHSSQAMDQDEQPLTAPAPMPMLYPAPGSAPSSSSSGQGHQPQANIHGALSSALGQLQSLTPTMQSSYSAHVVGQAPPPHPRFATADYAPARIFKLQFDARKIVCCTQAPIIVGWDFCNGDAELEEASRFFATID